jgi:hypothetical protein
MSGIVERMLLARTAATIVLGQKPNRCRLPPKEYGEFHDWIDTIEHDPFLGYHESGLMRHCLGMDIIEDTSLTEIICDVVLIIPANTLQPGTELTIKAEGKIH